MAGSKSLEQWQTVHGGGLHAVGAKGGLTGTQVTGRAWGAGPLSAFTNACGVYQMVTRSFGSSHSASDSVTSKVS